jgi:hypothetical protein
MDELKEFGWDGDRREHLWALLKPSPPLSGVGETLSQSPCVWSDAVPEDELLAVMKAEGLLPDDMWGKCVGWKTRSCGVYYPKEVQVKRDLQLGWNRV